ncbi:MAG: tetratricopeptide repeat protein [Planctomycetes bacterium]|nr:tetratricopeptide repeat protein [Planctomycetota bacterium]
MSSFKLSVCKRPAQTAVCSGVSLVFLAGCTLLGPGERQSLIEAKGLYDQSRFADAINKLNPVIRDFGQAVEIGEAYYLRGLCRSKLGDPKGAAADFEQSIASSRNDSVIVRSKISLAAVSFQTRQWSKAADLYVEVVPRLDDKPPADQVMYYAGTALRRAGRWREATQYFARILHRFPDSPIAADARRMAGWQHEYFAIQLGAYQDAGNAERAVQAYRTRNLDFVQMENHPWGGRVLWAVMTGRYRSYEDAVAALGRIRSVAPDANIIP